MKFYDGQKTLAIFKRGKYPFPKKETVIRVRHGGASFDSKALEFHCLFYGLSLKHVEIVKFQDGSIDFVSVFEKKN